jgi:hypothetical protein
MLFCMAFLIGLAAGLFGGLIFVGIIIGTYCGGSVAHLLSEANLRQVFAAMLIWLGLRDIRGARIIKIKVDGSKAVDPVARRSRG